MGGKVNLVEIQWHANCFTQFNVWVGPYSRRPESNKTINISQDMEMQMSSKTKAGTKTMISAFAGAIVLSFSASAFSEDAVAVKVDAVAAKKLARKDSCLRCHHVSKKKEGPSYQSIAYKYKGKSDAADTLVKHITSGEDRVKLSDGHEEMHKVTRTTDVEQVRNLVNWILAQ